MDRLDFAVAWARACNIEQGRIDADIRGSYDQTGQFWRQLVVIGAYEEGYLPAKAFLYREAGYERVRWQRM